MPTPIMSYETLIDRFCMKWVGVHNVFWTLDSISLKNVTVYYLFVYEYHSILLECRSLKMWWLFEEAWNRKITLMLYWNKIVSTTPSKKLHNELSGWTYGWRKPSQVSSTWFENIIPIDRITWSHPSPGTRKPNNKFYSLDLTCTICDVFLV